MSRDNSHLSSFLNSLSSLVRKSPPIRKSRRSAVRQVERLEQRQLLVGDISGQVYNDVNRNAINDVGDRSLAGWTVFVDSNANNVLNAGETFTTTDPSGKYLMAGLVAGTYRVAVALQPGFAPLPGRSNFLSVSVRDRRAVSANFPLITAPVTTGRVTGTIFEDFNENGIKDVGDGSLSGWTVFADTNNDGSFTTGEPSTVSNTDGDYVLATVPSGTLNIFQTPVGGYRTTAGGLFPLLNAPNSRSVTLVAGGTATANFPNWIPQVGTIQGNVWNDGNGDGLRGATESPMAARTVYVDLNANGLLDTTEPSRITDAFGNYSLVDIRTGVYQVTELLPAGFITSEGRPQSATTLVVRAGISVADFFNLQPLLGSITGTLWNDADGDGIFSATESPLQGWQVYLDLNGNAVLDATDPQTNTAANGTYSFSGVSYGTQTLRVMTPPNWGITSPPTGSSTVKLLNGENRTGVNFGARELVGIVQGTVWNDANGDGVRQVSEAGLAGQTIFLDTNGDGVPGAGEPSVITAADGTYSFTRIPTGTVRVTEVVPAGWITTIGKPTALNVTVGVGSFSTVDFYNLQPQTGSVSGVVFNDVNSDGLLNGTDAALDGWQIYVDQNANGSLDAGEPSAVSDLLGAYTISGLPYGNVRVRQVSQIGFTATTFPTGGTSFLLLNGQNRTGVSFGNHDLQQFGISGTVFSDANLNGTRDAGERGLSGVTVYLDTNNNGLLDAGEPTTVSLLDYYFTPAVNEAGNYSFTHLGHGTYTIREIVPASMDATPSPARVRTVTLPSVAPVSADFANVFRSNEIHGVVFHDTDDDAVLDANEYVRPGVPVYIDLDRDDIFDPGEPEAITGIDGSYSFVNLTPGAYVVREELRPPGAYTTPLTGGGILWPAGTSQPAKGNVMPTSLTMSLGAGETFAQTVSLTLPAAGSLSTMVDVFLLFDDTGSFTANSPIIRAAFPTIISTLQASLPGVDLGFGVGRFEEYGSFAGEVQTGRPFILNHPIVESTRPGFAAAIQAALDRTTPGFGGDGPETDIEGLYQLVTGLGFDGNNNGSTSESGPAGPASTQLTPGISGDVPAFSSFLADPVGNVLAPAGRIGGAGFRSGALPVILTATDIGFAYQPKGETVVTGVNGVTLPVSALTQISRPTTPFSAGAGLQETVTGLNALGALVIGLGTNAITTQDPRQALESLAKLTGAVNRSTTPIANGTPAPILPGDPLYFQITTGFGATVADGVTNAIQNAVTNVAMDITVRASDPRVVLVNNTGVLPGIGAGQTATFDIQFIGDGRPARFDLQFVRVGTDVVLGSIPVVMGTPIAGDGYQFDDLLDGDIHRSSHFGHYVPNEAPSFVAGTDVSVSEDAGTISVTGWATGIAAGPATESLQSVTFVATNSNPGLFSAQPAVAPDGTLTFTSAPNAFGTALVTLFLQDNGGTGPGGIDRSSPVSFLISVNSVNDVPVAANDQWELLENTTLTVPVSGVLANDTDADGDVLSAVLLTNAAHGIVSLAADGAFVYTSNLNYFGPDSFTYAANDGVVNSTPATVNLLVTHNNQIPSVLNDAWTGTEDTILTVTAPGVLANDTDANGDILSVRVATGPTHGVLTLNSDGSFVYTPALNFAGLDSFTYIANDGFGDSVPATVTLTVVGVNDVPVAVADRYTTAEDTVLAVITGGLLSNDTDADSDVLTAVKVLDPLHGTLVLNANGTFTYTPALNYFGEDVFSYYATDGVANSGMVTATMTITAVNDAPVATADSYSLNEDTSLNILGPGVLANDFDPEGSIITATRLAGPAHGALTFNANGSFTYVPVANYNGPDSFTYSASDGSLSSAAVTVSITVFAVNDAPNAANDTYSTNWNTPLTIAAAGVLLNDRDVDGDPMTAIPAAAPAHGTVTLNADGSFVYVPAANYSGPDSFQYQAFDGTVRSAAAIVSLTVNPPALVPKFFVVDATSVSNSQYAPDGTPITSTALNRLNTRPRGVATNPTGTIFWVMDAVGDVFIYDKSGLLLGQWTPLKVGKPEGITVWGNDLWVVDPTADRVYKFTGGAALRTGKINFTSTFLLHTANLNATDMVTDGTRIWVVDDTLATDRVFRYSAAGAFQGSWTLSPVGPTPTGITLDPNSVNHLWVVDSTTDRVYQYDGATALTAGAGSTTISFPLASNNLNATGIADPRIMAGEFFGSAATPEPLPAMNRNRIMAPGRSVTTSRNLFAAQSSPVVQPRHEVNDTAAAGPVTPLVAPTVRDTGRLNQPRAIRRIAGHAPAQPRPADSVLKNLDELFGEADLLAELDAAAAGWR